MTMMTMSLVIKRNRRKGRSARHVVRKSLQRKTRRKNARRMTRMRRKNHTILTITQVARVAKRAIIARKRIVKSVLQKDISQSKRNRNNQAIHLRLKKFASNST